MCDDRKIDYDSWKGTDVDEFFSLLWIQDDKIQDRLKKLEELESKAKKK